MCRSIVALLKNHENCLKNRILLIGLITFLQHINIRNEVQQKYIGGSALLRKSADTYSYGKFAFPTRICCSYMKMVFIKTKQYWEIFRIIIIIKLFITIPTAATVRKLHSRCLTLARVAWHASETSAKSHDTLVSHTDTPDDRRMVIYSYFLLDFQISVRKLYV